MDVASRTDGQRTSSRLEANLFKGMILWILGVPVGIIILLLLFGIL
jgi:hypothetical protein